MKPALARFFASLLIVILTVPQSWATCGGGGGGGMGGIAPSGPGPSGAQQQVYNVPWKLLQPTDPPVATGLVLYWIPISQDEVRNSSLRVSRPLSLYAAECVSMAVVDPRSPARAKFAGDSKLPVAVLAAADGTVIGKTENKDGKLKVEQVEKLVETERKRREDALEQQLKAAKERAKSGDNAGAVPIYRAVLEQKCLFPDKAKSAAKELKKLGVTDVGQIQGLPMGDAPNFDPAVSARIVRTMHSGLRAELAGKYTEAGKLYAAAHAIDPADATPLRYLGELYRHHTGEWAQARVVFNNILEMQSDPMSRAVAMHGLGKMTIHEGDFAKGLSLLEHSVKTYPLALAYRNLAVYWNSEGDTKKADEYVQQALKLDPKDPYNLIFAAAFMAGNGKGDQALKIARENESLLPASYNLAAIYAQTGQRDKALSLLKRHFYQYERFAAVRAEEMMEARVDAVFASLKTDPAFVALTQSADGKLDTTRTMTRQ